VRTKFSIPILAIAMALATTACLPTTGPAARASSQGLVSAINADRNAEGVGGLAEDGQLDLVAQSWADTLAATGQLAHQGLIGFTAENVFLGPGSATTGLVETTWMASPEHRMNILNPGFHHVGVGVAHDRWGRTFVVADFR
jgi:uncharacterized protein YkwD